MIRFMRKYEKYVFWGIVIVILPSFSITGIMMTTCNRRAAPPRGKLWGKDVQQDEFDAMRARLASYFRATGRELSEEAVWSYLTFVRKAEEAGITVSDAEVRDAVQRFFRAAQARQHALERLNKDFGQLNPRFREQLMQRLAEDELQKTQWSEERYLEYLDGLHIQPGSFEEGQRTELLVQKLEQLVEKGAKPDPQKVYDRYEEEYQRRKAVYASVKAEDYPLSETGTTVAELKTYYDRHQDRFKEPERVDVEWLFVPVETVRAQVQDPTDQEIETRYELSKSRYRVETPVPATPTATTATAEVYRPLLEVKPEIAKELRAEREVEAVKVAAEAARSKALAGLTAGAPVTLSALAAEKAARYGRSGLTDTLDLVGRKGAADIQAMSLLGAVEKLQARGPASLSEVALNRDRTGAFFLHILERRPAQVPPFAEIEEKVRRSYFGGLDQELEKHYGDHISKYKKPAVVTLEYVHVPYKRFEKAVPQDVTGSARAVELRKRAEELLDEIRTAYGAKPSEEGSKARDLDTIALDKGADDARVTTQKNGKDLPAEARAPDVLNRLDRSEDKPGQLSPTFENDAKTGVFAYVVRSTEPEEQLSFEQAKGEIQKEIRLDRQFDRAREAAEAFAKEVGPHPESFRALAAKRGLRVNETPFVTRTEKIEGLPDSAQLVGGLFMAQDLGALGRPAFDSEHKVAYVLRYAGKESADPKGFAEKESELRDEVQASIEREYTMDWVLRVRLESRGIGEPVLREAYGLLYGPDGLSQIQAAQVYIAADPPTIRAALETRAKGDAEKALADLRAGARFEDLARKRSQDQKTRRKGGDMGFLGKGRMSAELEAALAPLEPGQIGGPVKDAEGWHLLMVVERRAGEVRARHILFRSERAIDEEGNPAPLDPAILKDAMARSLEKARSALDRVKGGEDFASVAKEVSSEPGAGERRSYSFETPFALAVLAQEPRTVSDVVTIGGEQQLLLVESASSRAQVRAGKARVAHRIVMSGQGAKERLAGVREKLMKNLDKLEEERRRSELRGEFEKLAQRYSEAPSGKAVSGRVGVVRADPELERAGAKFREALYSLGEGQVSELVEGPEGYHIIKVLERKKKSFDEARRDVAAGLLEGLDL